MSKNVDVYSKFQGALSCGERVCFCGEDDVWDLVREALPLAPEFEPEVSVVLSIWLQVLLDIF